MPSGMESHLLFPRASGRLPLPPALATHSCRLTSCSGAVAPGGKKENEVTQANDAVAVEVGRPAG